MSTSSRPSHALAGKAAMLALVLVAAAGSVAGQPASPALTPANPSGASGPTAASASLARGDRRFAEKAALDGLAEVQLGQLAQDRGSDPQVKAFGSSLMQDHAKANEELVRIVGGKGLKAPTQLDRAHQRDVERLGKLRGAEFDREFMKLMVDDHKKSVSDFQKAADSARDAELKAFASRTLPTLQAHLKTAQTTYDAVKNVRSSAAPGTAASR